MLIILCRFDRHFKIKTPVDFHTWSRVWLVGDLIELTLRCELARHIYRFFFFHFSFSFLLLFFVEACVNEWQVINRNIKSEGSLCGNEHHAFCAITQWRLQRHALPPVSFGVWRIDRGLMTEGRWTFSSILEARDKTKYFIKQH